MTAASPIWRGYLADVDSRWNVISGSVDDRTEEERGLKVSRWIFGLIVIHLQTLFSAATGREQIQDSKVTI